MATKATTLFSLGKVKAHLKVNSANTSFDTPITSIADGVSERVESYTRRKFVSQTITETVTPRREDRLQLNQYPVVSITTVKTRVVIQDTLTLVPSTDYTVDKRLGVLYAIGTPFPADIPLGIEVVYVAGFDVQDGPLLPADVVLAALEYTKFVYDRWSNGTLILSSASMQGQSASIIPGPPKDVAAVLDVWKKIRV